MPSRKSRNSVRKTRKSRGLTVEALHASFDKIDRKVQEMIEKGATDSALAACIHRCCLELFHMPVSGVAVKALVAHYRAIHGSKRLTRKNKGKGQRGGMAPLDYMMGPGLSSQSYGRFPVEMGTTPNVLNGLDLGRFYESTAGRSCNTTGGHPAINQRGGKQRGGASLWQMLTTPSNLMSSVYNGHVPPSVPINGSQSVANAVMGGQPLGPHASPVADKVALSVYTPKPYDPSNVMNMPGYQSLYKPS
jgi:hypothetical protein